MSDDYVENLDLSPNVSLCTLLGPHLVEALIADAAGIIERGEINDCGSGNRQYKPRRDSGKKRTP